MTTSPSPIRFSAPLHTTAEISAKKAKDYEAVAQLVENLIPNFKKQEEKQFYCEVVQSYRAAARNILRKALSTPSSRKLPVRYSDSFCLLTHVTKITDAQTVWP